MTETVLYGVFQGFAVAIGLSLGSFCNVCIDRLPHLRSLLPRSACDACGHRIRPIDLVPVLSYLALRGRCRDCGAPIGVHVPMVEALVGMLSWLLFRRLVPDLTAIDLPHMTAWGVFLGFLCLLVVAAYTDVRHRIIPDETSLLAVPFGVGATALLGWLGYDGWLHIGWRASVAGVMLWGGFFVLARVSARAVRGSEALGAGDVKMVAMIGAFLGSLPGGLVVLMLASVGASIAGLVAMVVLRARPWLPFGPALAIASALWVFYGDAVVAAWFPHLAFLL